MDDDTFRVEMYEIKLGKLIDSKHNTVICAFNLINALLMDFHNIGKHNLVESQMVREGEKSATIKLFATRHEVDIPLHEWAFTNPQKN